MQSELQECVEVSLPQAQQYWETQLAGELPVLDFPSDAANTAPDPAFQHILIDARLTAALRTRSQQAAGGTLLSGVVALVTSLLHWYTRQPEVVVTTSFFPAAGASESFAALPLRMAVRATDSFEALLGRAADTVRQASRHRGASLDEVVAALQLTPEVIQRSLLAVQLVYQQEPAAHRAPVTVPGNPALLVWVTETTELAFTIEYNAAQYSAALMAQLGRHLRQLLEAVLAQPAQPLGQAELLSAGEKQQLLEAFNDSAIAFAEDGATIVELFENRVRELPDNIALVCDGAEMTYRELNVQADQLARRILAQAPLPAGAEQNRLVALCLERGFHVYVAMLAILKSGAGYVPIDPHYPEERVAFMLQDTQAGLVLTEPRMLEAKPYLAGEGRQVLVLGANEGTEAAPAGPPALPRRVAGTDVAYVIYTSGSTGLPKGVLIEHDQIAATMLHMRHYYGLGAADTCVYYRSYCFDGSIEETLLPIISGARVVIVPTNTDEDLVAYLYRIIEQYQITKINTPPAFLHLFLERIEEGAALHSLRHLVSGGDVLNKALLGRLHASLTAKVHNTYGPTENTIDSTVFEVDRGAQYHTVPIGKPTANSSCYILNECLQPVPVGVVGELCVGGTGVGRGYLNRPELTAQRFIANPFAGAAELGYANARLYKTGDLARWLPDGNIEFLGRIDNQVKIRGFRIELEEIESSLLQHPDIDSAVVVVRQFEHSKELVAYLVSKAPQSADGLRAYLKAKMPDYMVPSYFVQLPEMPISTTGKVNKNALPDPKTAALTSSQQHLAARNPHEEKLAAIWKEVLNRDTVGVKDNFIDLGGTSLSAIRVIQRLRTEGYKISTRDFLQNLVLEEQAAVLVATGEQPAETAPTPNTTVALSSAQQRALQQAVAQPLTPAALVLRSPQALPAATVTKVVEKLVGHHELLRATLAQAEGQWQLHVAAPAAPALHFFDYQALPAATADEQQQREVQAQQASLGPNQPAVKFLVFHRAAGDQLFIVAHALLLDLASWPVLVDDLGTLFAQASQGQPLQLTSPGNGFQQWSAELANYPGGSGWAREQAAWAAVDAACAAAAPVQANAATQRRTFSISRTITRQALREANQAFDTTTEQLLAAAFLQALRKVLGLHSVPLAMTASAREQAEGSVGNQSRALGNFSYQYPILMEAPATDSWAEILPDLRHAFEQVPNQGVGYGLRKTATPAPALPFSLAYQEAALTSHLTAGSFVAAQCQPGTLAAPAAGLGLSATLLDDRLQVEAAYDPAAYAESVMDALQAAFEAALGEVVAFGADYSRTRGPLYRLSYNQQYYFRGGDLDQSRGLLPEFVVPAASAAQLPALCAQLLAAVDILRVRFERHRGEVLQRVVPAAAAAPDIRRHQVRDARHAAAVEPIFQRELHQPFHFDDAQFVRFVLVHDEQVARCQIVVHHAVTDGSSNQLIVQLIHALMRGDQSLLAEHLHAAPRYWDFIRWQRGFMRSAKAQQQLAYWTSNLAGFEHAAALPQVASQEEQFDYLFKVSQRIDGENYRTIVAFCKAQGIDLSSFFLTAFALTLYAKNARPDLLIDTFSNGRDQVVPGVAMPELIGVILNKLPLKLRLQEQLSLAEACRQTMELYYEGRLHQQIPYIEVEKALRAAYHRTLGDFGQVRFNYFDLSAAPLGEGAGGPAKDVKLLGNNAALLGNYRLILDCKAYQDAVKLEWKYPCTEQFEGWEDALLPAARLITDCPQAPLARIRAAAAPAAAPPAPEVPAESADELVTMTI